MDKPQFDVAIIGAGPTGSTLALQLARQSPVPARIALIDPQLGAHATAPSCEATNTTTVVDPRILALNYGSRQALEALDAWPGFVSDIHTVHISQARRLGQTFIRHNELHVPQLGSVVTYRTLRSHLHQALEKSGVTLLNERHIRTIQSATPRLELAAQAITAHLVVQSDGGQPGGLQRRYQQQALTCTVRASQPQPAWAYERFTQQGPLAFLPHPEGNDLYGIVWCCEPARAQQLLEASPETFTAALLEQFGERLGTLSLVGARHLLDLAMHVGPQRLGSHTIAIGNAAQTLHPVAGQGFNLALRDAIQLASTLAPWLAQPAATPPPLHHFAQQRSSDRWVSAGVTHFLSKVFATGNPLVQHAAGLGLLALDLCPPLRQPLARQLLYGWRN